MKVLITGIGITGKSTFRRLLVEKFCEFGLRVEHFDMDKFEELRHPSDIDCQKELPRVFQGNAVYIIEDVHGLIIGESAIELGKYDLIFYLWPNFFSHFLFWLSRAIVWFKRGRFSWEARAGWNGTGKPRDWRNVVPIVREFYQNFKNRKEWIKKDVKVITTFPHFIVRSFWTKEGPNFKILFPSK